MATFKVKMTVDYKDTKGINSKTLKKTIIDAAGDQLTTYQYLTGPGWFQKSQLDEIFFSGVQNLLPLATHFESTVIDPLLEQGNIITGSVKLHKYKKISETESISSFVFQYRQKHCVNATKLVIKFACSFVD